MKTKVKQVDSLSFTIGVTVTYLVQWIVLMRPAMLKYFYYASMLILLPHRYILAIFLILRMFVNAFHQKNNDIIKILFFQIFHIQGRKGSFLYDRLLLPSKSIRYSADIVLWLWGRILRIVVSDKLYFNPRADCNCYYSLGK